MEQQSSLDNDSTVTTITYLKERVVYIMTLIAGKAPFGAPKRREEKFRPLYGKRKELKREMPGVRRD